MHGGWMREEPQDYSAYMRARIEGGFFIPATWYIQALSHRGPALAAFLERVMSKCDVLHLPTVPIRSRRLRNAIAEHRPEAPRDARRNGGLTRPFNYLGVPAMSVPCGFDEKVSRSPSSSWRARSTRRACARRPRLPEGDPLAQADTAPSPALGRR